MTRVPTYRMVWLAAALALFLAASMLLINQQGLASASATVTQGPSPTPSPTIDPSATKSVYLPLAWRVDPPTLTPTLTPSLTPTHTATPTASSTPTQGAAPGWSDFELQVLALVNQERSANGCTVMLAADDLLHQAAYNHSLDMLVRDFFSHTNPDGEGPGQRLNELGYAWWEYAENIAAGYSSPEAVMNGWMNSPDHRDNILNCNSTEIGVGYVYDANDGGSVRYYHYWTQVFAKPR